MSAPLKMDADDVNQLSKFLTRLTVASTATGCTLAAGEVHLPGVGSLAYRWDGDQYVIDDRSGE